MADTVIFESDDILEWSLTLALYHNLVRLATNLSSDQFFEIACHVISLGESVEHSERIFNFAIRGIYLPTVSDGRQGMLALVPSLSLTVTTIKVAVVLGWVVAG